MTPKLEQIEEVAVQAKAFLSWQPDRSFTTQELAEGIEADAGRRKVVYAALGVLPLVGMGRWFSYGPARQLYGHDIRPKIWRKPQSEPVCPGCGRPL